MTKKAVVSQLRQHEKYERLVAATKDLQPLATAVAHPCDESSLRGALEAAEAGIITPILVGPEEKIRSVAKSLDARHRGHRDRRRPAQPGGGGESGRARSRGQSRTVDERKPAFRRAAGGSREAGDGTSHRPAHQPRLRHGRSDPSADVVHHRRRGEHRARSAGEARHHPERHRPLCRTGAWHAQGRHSVGGRDGKSGHSLDHRRGGSLQNGRSRPDHRRRARWPARLRQRDQSRGGAHQGHQVAGGRPGPDPGRAGSRSRQHACQEPVVSLQGRCGRHRARRTRARHTDLARGQCPNAAWHPAPWPCSSPTAKGRKSRSGPEP